MSIIQLVARCTPQEWHIPLELSPLPSRGSAKGLWIDPVALISLLNGWALAEWAMRTARRLRWWALPKPPGPGAPQVYRDESVLLTSLVAAAWRLSFERITEWLARYDTLAEALGYHQFDGLGRRRTISLAQYSRRLQELGLLPYFLIFVALVLTLLRMGLIQGWDLIIDSSLLAAWYHGDPDAAYFNYAFLAFVHDVLPASINVDYNLRRRGKRFLADLFFIRQWRDLMRPRANIERHFAWMKRYFGLKDLRVQGYLAVTQFVFRVYIAALIVAFIAARHQRPELATARLKVLAFVNT
jgi:hypothetical protein